MKFLNMKIFFILMEMMGKQYSQTPLKSPTMLRKYCVGVGEEGDLGEPATNFIFGLKSFLFTASPHKDYEIAILQDKRHYIRK